MDDEDDVYLVSWYYYEIKLIKKKPTLRIRTRNIGNYVQQLNRQ